MRTTLRIDDDVLQVARRLARSTGRTVGEVRAVTLIDGVVITVIDGGL